MTHEPTTLRTTYFVEHGEDPAKAIAALHHSLLDGDFIAFDDETNALWASDRRDRVTSIQIGSRYVAVLLDPTDPSHVAAAREVLNERRYRLTAHNAGFDILRLVRLGVFDSVADAWARTTDTIILARLLTSGQHIPVGLKEFTRSWCGDAAVAADALEEMKTLQKTMGTKGVGKNFNPYTQVTLDADGNPLGDPETGNTWALLDRRNPVFRDYCAGDVFDSATLAESLDPVVRGLYPEIVESEHMIHRIACEMAYRGVRFDRSFAVPAYREAVQQRDAAAAGLEELGVDITYKAKRTKAGEEPDEDAEKDDRDRHVADAIRAEGIHVPAKRTKNGAMAPVLDKRALKKYAAEGSKIAPLYREWGKAQKLISTYLAPYLKLDSERIHPDIDAGGARTGRMSCNSPNAQNVPPEVRGCYVADPGMYLISADFSSVEMRVGAGITGDPELTWMYTAPLPPNATEQQLRERDPYWQIAWQVWGPDATTKDRSLAKIVVLANTYGGGREAIAEEVGVPVQTVASVLTGYQKRFPQLKKWFEETMTPSILAGSPYWVLPTGRWQSIDPTRAWAGLNMMIQGTARDLLVQAMIRLDEAGLGEYMLLPIHDEVVFQVPVERALELRDRITDIMGSVFLGIPITAEADVLGPRWTKDEDVIAQYNPDRRAQTSTAPAPVPAADSDHPATEFRVPPAQPPAVPEPPQPQPSTVPPPPAPGRRPRIGSVAATYDQPVVDPTATVYADGGSRGSRTKPGAAGFGAAVLDATDSVTVLAEVSEALPEWGTNNVAEYGGLIAGMTKALELGHRRVEVRLDSQLLVEQMRGVYAVKAAHLKPLHARARELASQFEGVAFTRIPREGNSHADRLANEAMDAQASRRAQEEEEPL